MMMRDGHNIGRFDLLPFSIGCDSESSVALAATTTGTATGATNSPKTRHFKPSGQRSEEKKQSRVNTKQTPGLPNASVSQRLHRLINRLFKSFSQLFLYKEDMVQIEKEMEIGFPTDVKHVTHIGLDGSSRINNTPKATDEIINVAFPSISLEQFELAMAAQSKGPFPLGMKTQSSTLAPS